MTGGGAARLLPAWAGVLSALLFSASVWMPPVGFALSLASPGPLALATWRSGLSGGLLSLLVGVGVTAVIVGPEAAAIYAGQFAAGGCVMGLALRAGRGPAAVVGGYTAVAVGAFWLTLAVAAMREGVGLGVYVGQLLDQTSALFAGAFQQEGLDPETVLAVQAGMDETYRSLRVLFPGLMVCLSVLTGWGNALALRRSAGGGDGWDGWRAPEWLIWVLVGAGLAGVLTAGVLSAVGWNLFAVAATVYFLQGMAVIHRVMAVRGLPRMFRIAAYLLIFLQFPVTMLVAGVGAFDLWFDFRARLAPSSPPAGGGTRS